MQVFDDGDVDDVLSQPVQQDAAVRFNDLEFDVCEIFLPLLNRRGHGADEKTVFVQSR